MIDDTKKTDLSVFLKDAQKLLNMSNQDVSDILHCTPTQVSQIKNPLYWKMVPKSTWEFLLEWKEQRKDVTSIMVPDTPVMEPDKALIALKRSVAPVPQTPYPVEHGIPIPARAQPFDVYQLHRLEVGDSIALPIVPGWTSKQIYSRVDSAVSKFRKTHPDTKFTCRHIKEESVVRCWRIE